MFSHVQKKSPVLHQDFVWIAEYYDGTHLAEFDFQTKEEQSFYKVDKKQLVRFGLIGLNRAFFAEADGVFNLAGQTYQVSYVWDGNEYLLSGNLRNTYNDIITFKDAHATGLANFKRTDSEGVFSPTITKFSFGYKTKVMDQGVTFHFKPLISIPLNEPMSMNIWLVADKKMDGRLIIKKRETVVKEIYAPLEPGVGGELNWIIH